MCRGTTGINGIPGVRCAQAKKMAYLLIIVCYKGNVNCGCWSTYVHSLLLPLERKRHVHAQSQLEDCASMDRKPGMGLNSVWIVSYSWHTVHFRIGRRKSWLATLRSRCRVTLAIIVPMNYWYSQLPRHSQCITSVPVIKEKICKPRTSGEAPHSFTPGKDSVPPSWHPS